VGVLTGGDGKDTVGNGVVVCVPLVVLVGLGESVCEALSSACGVALRGSPLLEGSHSSRSRHWGVTGWLIAGVGREIDSTNGGLGTRGLVEGWLTLPWVVPDTAAN